MQAFLATLSPSRVPTTSWPTRSRFLSCLHSGYSNLSEIHHNCSRRLCSRFRHQSMQVLHLPCLWSLLLLGRPETQRRSFHSTRLFTSVCWLVSRTLPPYSFHQTPLLPTRPRICAAPKCTLEGHQGIQGVIEACISHHIIDFLNKGNRILPSP